MGKYSGTVMSVLGPVNPSELGITMLHEHFFQDPGPTPVYFRFPDDPSERRIAQQPLSLENLGWARFNYLNHWDLNIIDDEDLLVEEIERFKVAGGRTICNVSTRLKVHKPMKKLSIRSGINIISGSGFYVSTSYPPEMDRWSVDEVKEVIVNEFREGKSGTDEIRPGIIGEIGVTYPWGKNEKKVLQASARAMNETGLALEIHPGRNPRQVKEIIDVVEAEKPDMNRVVICHMDRTIDDIGIIKKVMDRGCYVGYDAFGLAWYPWDMEIPYPSDSMRIFQIRKLVEAGYAHKIVLSHDIDDKHTLYHYGGWGYAHILNNIVPVMKRNGITQDQINMMLVETPRKLLTID